MKTSKYLVQTLYRKHKFCDKEAHIRENSIEDQSETQAFL